MRGCTFKLALSVFAACVLGAASSPAAEPLRVGEYIQVEVVGQLRHDVVAIGGETTGTEITVSELTFELVLESNPVFLKRAEQLSGRKARVTGRLEVREGVERGTRYIVQVKSLEPAP